MSAPEGITNHPASEEAAEDAKLKGPKPVSEPTPTLGKEAEKPLPTGMAEKVETVEVSTMTPHK